MPFDPGPLSLDLGCVCGPFQLRLQRGPAHSCPHKPVYAAGGVKAFKHTGIIFKVPFLKNTLFGRVVVIVVPCGSFIVKQTL